MSEPAFPTHYTEMAGMSLRDYFAAKAMQSEINSKWYQKRAEEESWKCCANDLATDAYTIADAMLEARKKEGK